MRVEGDRGTTGQEQLKRSLSLTAAALLLIHGFIGAHNKLIERHRLQGVEAGSANAQTDLIPRLVGIQRCQAFVHAAKDGLLVLIRGFDREYGKFVSSEASEYIGITERLPR